MYSEDIHLSMAEAMPTFTPVENSTRASKVSCHLISLSCNLISPEDCNLARPDHLPFLHKLWFLLQSLGDILLLYNDIHSARFLCVLPVCYRWPCFLFCLFVLCEPLRRFQRVHSTLQVCSLPNSRMFSQNH